MKGARAFARQRKAAALGVGLLALVGLASPRAEEADARRIADLVYSALDAERRAEGHPPWERREPLDRVAGLLAHDLAAVPGRSLSTPPVEKVLRREGVRGFRRAMPLTQSLRGHRDPAGSAVETWREYDRAWKRLMDPAVDAIGLADRRSVDGRIVLVAVLLEDGPAPEEPAAVETAVAAAVNEIRVGRGLAALEVRPDLVRLARDHSRDMARRGYFDHRTPEGVDATRRVERSGAVYRALAENISRVVGVEDPAGTAVRGWMGSSRHRANILGPSYRVTGVGAAVDETGTVYVTQIFLDPAPPF